MHRGLWIGLGFAALVGGWVWAGSLRNALDIKQQLVQDIEALTREYQAVQRLQSAVVHELDRLRLQEQILHRQIQLLQIHLQETRIRIHAVQDQVRQLRREWYQYRRLLERRIRIMYRMGPAYPLKLLVSLRDARRILQATAYAAAVARLDHTYAQRYVQTVQQLRHRLLELRQLEQVHETQLERLQRKRRQLVQVRRRRETYLAELKRRGDMYVRALDELTLAFHRLNKYVRESEYYPLLDIRKFRGLLDWPVVGPIVRPFGRILLPETGTSIISRGIEIAVPEGTPVRAVFDGKVRYAGWYTAYGKLIILDHGYDVYTLYAHNSVIQVRVGQVVRKGQIIAISGRTGSLRGPALYFEIREHVQARNPLDWLKVLPEMPVIAGMWTGGNG